jgi:hypothetical protein
MQLPIIVIPYAESRDLTENLRVSAPFLSFLSLRWGRNLETCLYGRMKVSVEDDGYERYGRYYKQSILPLVQSR